MNQSHVGTEVRVATRDLTVRFPAVTALSGVNLEFAVGEVHGVIGENGAGKSTLMRVLSGLQTPTEGSLEVHGRPVSFQHVGQALKHGIAMIHQELNLVDDLTVSENIFLGRELTRFGRLRREEMAEIAKRTLQRVKAPFTARDLLGKLSLAQKQLVEIAKALTYNATTLIMDEPTAVLSETEANVLFDLIRELRSKEVTVLYISHRLAEVEDLCDRITVLRDGEHVRTVRRGEATQKEFASLMVGRDLGELFPARGEVPSAEPLLQVRNIGDGGLLKGVSLDVRAGEIVGLGGLVGSGRTEFAETLVGIRRAKSGTIHVGGKNLHVSNPRDALQAGMAYVSEDRKDAGLLLSLDTVANTTLPNLRKYSDPLIDRKKEEASTRHWVDKLSTKVGDLRAPVLYLSGGNQQKVSVSKWLDTQPRILILDEPTRGVDVGAKREIYNLIHAFAEQGLACIVISSELSELLGLCHRIAVMREGRLVGEVAGESATEEQIMLLAAGV